MLNISQHKDAERKAKMQKRIREERKIMRWNQDRLAQALNLSRRDMVGKWETGKAEPSDLQLRQMGSIFGCSSAYLKGESDSKQIDFDSVISKTGLSEAAIQSLIHRYCPDDFLPDKFIRALNAILTSDEGIEFLDYIGVYIQDLEIKQLLFKKHIKPYKTGKLIDDCLSLLSTQYDFYMNGNPKDFIIKSFPDLTEEAAVNLHTYCCEIQKRGISSDRANLSEYKCHSALVRFLDTLHK